MAKRSWSKAGVFVMVSACACPGSNGPTPGELRSSGVVSRQVNLGPVEGHLAEGIEEKLSLAERFGIRLAFHPFDQDQYLAIVRHWLRRLGGTDPDSDETRAEALRWALERGSRSGRSAWQFARDRAGRQGLDRS